MKGQRVSLTRKVITSMSYLSSAQVINILCSIVRNKLMAIWVGTAGIGLNSILTNASSVISNGTQLNIRESAVRDLSVPMSYTAYAIKATVIRKWSLLLGLLGAIASVVFSPILSATAYAGSYSNWPDFAMLAPTVFLGAYISGETAILQSCGRVKSIARANLMGGMIGTIVSIPLIYYLRISSIICIINAATFCVAISFFCLRERIVKPVEMPKLDFKTLWSQGKSVILLGITISVSVLMASIAGYILAAYINSTSGRDALGTYQSGYMLVNSYVSILFSAITVEFYPRLTRYVQRPKTAQSVMTHEIVLITSLITPMAVIFISMSDYIVRLLYSSQFEGVVPFVTFAIAGTIFRGISFCFAYRILASGDSRAYLFTESISIIIGLSLNIIAYKYWSYLGLGISYIVWYLFYAILTATVCRLRYGVRISTRLTMLITASIMSVGLAIYFKMFVVWWLPLASILPPFLIAGIIIYCRRK